jgi:SAM-dependent methyltransferase
MRVRMANGMHIADRLQNAIRGRREMLLRHVVPRLQRWGVLVPAWRAYERAIGLSARDRAVDERGVAVPPGYLRMLVAGTTSREAFLDSGRQAAESIRSVVAEAGMDLDRCDAVLDFGCGCGRVARWWPSDVRTEWHGCDYNARLVAWCAEGLPYLRVSVNPLEPPTTYRDGRFDAIYAISVFTHWPEPLQQEWMAELTRILAPGGRLLFTTHGEAAARPVLLPEELERFERGEFVVRFAEDAGSNLCSAFHPPQWTRERLAEGCEVLAHRPGGAPGLGNQDIWVVRRAD